MYRIPRIPVAQREALRNKKVSKLTNDELWIAYGAWAWKLCILVARAYRHVEPEHLLGTAFLWLKHSAKFYKEDGGASFSRFCRKIIVPRLHRHIYLEECAMSPRPKDKDKVKDKGSTGGVLSVDSLRESYISKADDSSRAALALGEVEQSIREIKRGNYNIYDLDPEQCLDISSKILKARQRLNYLCSSKDPVKRLVGLRSRKILFHGEQGADIAKKEKISRQAVNVSLRTGRLYIQDICDREKLTFDEARNQSANAKPRHRKRKRSSSKPDNNSR